MSASAAGRSGEQGSQSRAGGELDTELLIISLKGGQRRVTALSADRSNLLACRAL